jgi:hypothetical protein
MVTSRVSPSWSVPQETWIGPRFAWLINGLIRKKLDQAETITYARLKPRQTFDA